MSEHPYKPQPWRLTDYYPESYARFMDLLGDGIVPDWDDDDHNRHEAEFRADLAAHDAELRAQIAAELLGEAARARAAHRSAQTNHFAHDYCRWVGHAEALTSAAARITRGEKP